MNKIGKNLIGSLRGITPCCKCMSLFDDKDRELATLQEINIRQHSGACCQTDACCTQFKNPLPERRESYEVKTCCGR